MWLLFPGSTVESPKMKKAGVAFPPAAVDRQMIAKKMALPVMAGDIEGGEVDGVCVCV